MNIFTFPLVTGRVNLHPNTAILWPNTVIAPILLENPPPVQRRSDAAGGGVIQHFGGFKWQQNRQKEAEADLIQGSQSLNQRLSG